MLGRVSRWLLGGGLPLLLSACGAPSPRVFGDNYVSNDYPDAAVVAGTGALLYAVDGGCNKAGCPSDMRCNFKSERCERVRCTKLDAEQVCGSASQCSPRTGTCVSF